MQRFYERLSTYPAAQFPEVEIGRKFLAAATHQAVWSITTGGSAGLNSASLKHGDFDGDPDTLQSLAALLEQ
jgi:hypothetical protein